MSRRKFPPAGEFSAEIIDLDTEGRGVARVGGKITFIADALPGETVKFTYLRQSRDVDEGQMTVVEQASPQRVTPPCAHFGLCGGCSLQHLGAEHQISWKQKWLLDALERIGKVKPQSVAAPLTGPTTGYRRRARLGAKLVPKKGGVLVGFRERDSAYLAPLQQCETLDPRVGHKLRKLGALVESLSISKAMPQIEVAAAERVALVFRVLETPTEADKAKLIAFAAEEQFDIYLQPGGLDSIAPLSPCAPLDYSPDGSDLRLRFEPADFIQINGVMNQLIVRQALDWLSPKKGERVLELFCGLGNFSMPLARTGAEVIAAEGEAGLVKRARENAERNQLNIRFEKADLFNTAADVAWLQGGFDKLLLDPPRAGAKEILPAVAKKKPKKIVYVSCHPGTLARDAGTLVHEFGYTLSKAGVMDMFPHTAHVESMALFELI